MYAHLLPLYLSLSNTHTHTLFISLSLTHTHTHTHITILFPTLLTHCVPNRVYDQYVEETGTRPTNPEDQNWNRGYAASESERGEVAMPVRTAIVGATSPRVVVAPRAAAQWNGQSAQSTMV